MKGGVVGLFSAWLGSRVNRLFQGRRRGRSEDDGLSVGATAERREPVHLQRGRLGEDAAREALEKSGLRFLIANFRGRRGEIDLVFRDGDCLVFVEVKTRSSELWVRPSRAVGTVKRRALSRTALEFLRRVGKPRVAIRFDIVEVLLEEGKVREVRHLPGVFGLSAPYRYG